MMMEFDGWRSQIKDAYRAAFPLILVFLLVLLGIHFGGSTGVGVAIGGIAGLAINTRESLTYRLIIFEESYKAVVGKVIREMNCIEFEKNTFKLHSVLPQFDSQKIHLEFTPDHCIIVRSTKFNVHRIKKAIVEASPNGLSVNSK